MAVVLDPQKDRLLTTREAAKLAGVCQSRIRQMLRRGEIRGLKLTPSVWLVFESEAKRIAEEKSRVGRPRSSGGKPS